MADLGDNAGTKMNGIVISNMCEPPSVVIELAADKPSRRQPFASATSSRAERPSCSWCG